MLVHIHQSPTTVTLLTRGFLSGRPFTEEKILRADQCTTLPDVVKLVYESFAAEIQVFPSKKVLKTFNLPLPIGENLSRPWLKNVPLYGYQYDHWVENVLWKEYPDEPHQLQLPVHANFELKELDSLEWWLWERVKEDSRRLSGSEAFRKRKGSPEIKETFAFKKRPKGESH